MTRRRPGQGTLRQLPSGRWQVGFTLATGKRAWSRTTYATEAEADSARVGAVAALASGGLAAVGGVTFRAFASAVLDALEVSKAYAPATINAYRASFRADLCSAPWAESPLASLTDRAVAAHMHRVAAKSARSTATIALAVLRTVLREAREEGLLATDPTAGFRFKRTRRADAGEKRSFVTPAQFDALCAVATPVERCMFRIALGTGMRVMELVLLHVADWHVDADPPHVVVRYGSTHAGKLGPPKSGNVRTAMLLGPALDAAREWTDVHLPKMKNREGAKALVFPSSLGGFRRHRFLSGYSRVTGYRWHALLRAAGLADVQPAIVMHSLRHSAATALLSGQWGHKWAPEEVMRQLGHQSITTTMGYAKIVDARLAELAKITRRSRPEVTDRESPWIPGRAHDSGAGLAINIPLPGLPSEFAGLGGARDRGVIAERLAALAVEVLRSVASGSATRDRDATALAEAVLAALPASVGGKAVAS